MNIELFHHLDSPQRTAGRQATGHGWKPERHRTRRLSASRTASDARRLPPTRRSRPRSNRLLPRTRRNAGQIPGELQLLFGVVACDIDWLLSTARSRRHRIRQAKSVNLSIESGYANSVLNGDSNVLSICHNLQNKYKVDLRTYLTFDL